MPGRLSRANFDAFYARFAPSAHRRALMVLRRDADAWDVVQEVFHRAFQATLDFPNEAAALSWVYRATTNLSLKALRSRKYREPNPDDQALEAVVVPRHIEARNFARVLAADLSDREREVAVLHLGDGMSQDEIAEVLEVSRKTIVRDLQKIRDLARTLSTEGDGVA